jgi:hypothetical protein
MQNVGDFDVKLRFVNSIAYNKAFVRCTLKGRSRVKNFSGGSIPPNR